MVFRIIDVDKDIRLKDEAIGIIITKEKMYVALDNGDYVTFDIADIEGIVRIEQ